MKGEDSAVEWREEGKRRGLLRGKEMKTVDGGERGNEGRGKEKRFFEGKGRETVARGRQWEGGKRVREEGY